MMTSLTSSCLSSLACGAIKKCCMFARENKSFVGSMKALSFLPRFCMESVMASGRMKTALENDNKDKVFTALIKDRARECGFRTNDAVLRASLLFSTQVKILNASEWFRINFVWIQMLLHPHCNGIWNWNCGCMVFYHKRSMLLLSDEF